MHHIPDRRSCLVKVPCQDLLENLLLCSYAVLLPDTGPRLQGEQVSSVLDMIKNGYNSIYKSHMSPTLPLLGFHQGCFVLEACFWHVSSLARAHTIQLEPFTFK